MISEHEKITKVDIESTMKAAYIDYAMSVIVSRALPDARDGLKPVHRRIMFSMNEINCTYNQPHKKSARVVGDVLGKYHPHGDSSIYGALVRMAQDWAMRYTLVDGQGNFGSIDGDGPAAMRYTEVRLKQISNEMLADIDKNTVDFTNNFDDSLQEPTILPTRIPNLLLNGASGIAVGMATNMPTHNLREVMNGCIAFVDNPEITVEGLMEHILAPDFPLGGIIYGYNGVRDAFTTGRGSIIIRGETTIETDHKGRNIIIAHSIPYGINKAEMHKHQAQLVKEGKIEGITDIRDESSRKGIRLVYYLRHDAVPKVVLNKLYQYSELQSSFSVNNIALVKGRPQLLNLRDIISNFIEHREEVVTRRTRFELEEAEKRVHILAGLLKAIDVIDEVIRIIRASESVDDARNTLMATFGFSEIQARAIVEMRLRQLAGLERQKLQAEYDEKMAFIEKCKAILSDHNILMGVIRDELVEIRDKYGDDRRTQIEYNAANFRIEDTIPDEDVVITISHLGYIKRTKLTEYRTQTRGGVGSKGSSVRNEDFVEHIFTATNHNYLLLFTEQGRCYWLRAFEIPEGGKDSKGRAILNLINLSPDDKVKAYINVTNLKDEEYLNNHYVVLCSKNGVIKKTALSLFSHPRKDGIIALTIRDNDALLAANLTNGNCDIMLASSYGQVCRFSEDGIRPMGRGAAGVRGITLKDDSDSVISMLCVDNQDDIMVVSANGFGKRSSLDEYRKTNRGGKGVKAMQITEKTGALVSFTNVNDDQDLMIINRSGITIRMKVADMRVQGRNTQGVKLINLRGKDYIASITAVPTVEDEDQGENPEGSENAPVSPTQPENTENLQENNNNQD